MLVKPTKMAFETKYEGNSGVASAVRYNAEGYTGEVIEFYDGIYTVSFPIDKINWLQECLQKIAVETDND